MGVFATRSPFRPNPIGLSCVRLERIEQHPQWGPALWVAGADLMDGTPIYDVKPYLPYADCRPEAAGGFASQPKEASLRVECPPELLEPVEEARRAALLGVLAQDPRPPISTTRTRVVRSCLRRLGGEVHCGGGCAHRPGDLPPAAGALSRGTDRSISTRLCAGRQHKSTGL